MKTVIILLILPLIYSCSPSSFDKVDCSPIEVSENQNLKKIFKPCRKYIYSAKYWSADYELISDEKISVVSTGTDWEPQPDKQDKIIIQYELDESKIDHYNQFSLNPEFDLWTKKTDTGVTETASNVWIHPFRQNQYTFTEVAPFPDIKLPPEAGKSWAVDLNISDGWGVWGSSTVQSTYEIMGHESIILEYGSLKAWKVSSVGTASFGTSYHTFWYHEEYGFIKMVIKNYKGQILQFELVEVNG